jgi:hypothetical protein
MMAWLDWRHDRGQGLWNNSTSAGMCRGMQGQAIDSKLTAMGKDERAINVSGYVYRGTVKYTDHAFLKTSTHKNNSRHHLMEQVESFRIGDKDSRREDDLLDPFCYDVALALGDMGGF